MNKVLLEGSWKTMNVCSLRRGGEGNASGEQILDAAR
jgi:hypothetical protein